MTQGKLSVANKAPGTEGQQQANGEKKETPAVPSAPPSYEEATSGEGLKAGAFPPAPSAVPLHPSWAYVDPRLEPQLHGLQAYSLPSEPLGNPKRQWGAIKEPEARAVPTSALKDQDSSSSYESGFPTGDHEFFTTFSWDDQKVRRVFIRKVYTILLIQLLVTLGVVALFTFCDPVKDYVQANPGWYWASYAVFFATYLTLACCSGPRRHFPWNLILLTIFTLSMAYLTGMLSSYYNTTSVLLCLSITALVCLSVTVFSFQTKFDFTSCQGVLFVLLMTLFFSGLILAILLPFQYVPWLHAVYAVLGAGVFTLFLAFDTQLLMGSRRHSLSPEEYIFGALNIYLDIIYIFTFFLQRMPPCWSSDPPCAPASRDIKLAASPAFGRPTHCPQPHPLQLVPMPPGALRNPVLLSPVPPFPQLPLPDWDHRGWRPLWV
uniref:Protein lifeguard 2 n=1 Tax=Bos indicus x Bos taurus TaxID=30522 RepID=A0A4W2D1X9_BOBOX